MASSLLRHGDTISGVKPSAKILRRWTHFSATRMIPAMCESAHFGVSRKASQHEKRVANLRRVSLILFHSVRNLLYGTSIDLTSLRPTFSLMECLLHRFPKPTRISDRVR